MKNSLLLLFIVIIYYKGIAKQNMDKMYWKAFYNAEYQVIQDKNYFDSFNKLVSLEKKYNCHNDCYYLLSFCAIKLQKRPDKYLLRGAITFGENLDFYKT